MSSSPSLLDRENSPESLRPAEVAQPAVAPPERVVMVEANLNQLARQSIDQSHELLAEVDGSVAASPEQLAAVAQGALEHTRELNKVRNGLAGLYTPGTTQKRVGFSRAEQLMQQNSRSN